MTSLQSVKNLRDAFEERGVGINDEQKPSLRKKPSLMLLMQRASPMQLKQRFELHEELLSRRGRKNICKTERGNSFQALRKSFETQLTENKVREAKQEGKLKRRLPDRLSEPKELNSSGKNIFYGHNAKFGSLSTNVDPSKLYTDTASKLREELNQVDSNKSKFCDSDSHFHDTSQIEVDRTRKLSPSNVRDNVPLLNKAEHKLPHKVRLKIKRRMQDEHQPVKAKHNSTKTDEEVMETMKHSDGQNWPQDAKIEPKSEGPDEQQRGVDLPHPPPPPPPDLHENLESVHDAPLDSVPEETENPLYDAPELYVNGSQTIGRHPRCVRLGVGQYRSNDSRIRQQSSPSCLHIYEQWGHPKVKSLANSNDPAGRKGLHRDYCHENAEVSDSRYHGNQILLSTSHTNILDAPNVSRFSEISQKNIVSLFEPGLPVVSSLSKSFIFAHRKNVRTGFTTPKFRMQKVAFQKALPRLSSTKDDKDSMNPVRREKCFGMIGDYCRKAVPLVREVLEYLQVENGALKSIIGMAKNNVLLKHGPRRRYSADPDIQVYEPLEPMRVLCSLNERLWRSSCDSMVRQARWSLEKDKEEKLEDRKFVHKIAGIISEEAKRHEPKLFLVDKLNKWHSNSAREMEYQPQYKRVIITKLHKNQNKNAFSQSFSNLGSVTNSSDSFMIDQTNLVRLSIKQKRILKIVFKRNLKESAKEWKVKFRTEAEMQEFVSICKSNFLS